MTKRRATFKAAGLAACWLLVAAAPAPRPAAVFGFEFDDTSPQPPLPEEEARLRRLDAQLREALARSGQYAPVDTASVATAEAASSLRSCAGCAVDLARKLGAAVAVNGWVQKVSTLILNINLVVRDATSGKVLRAGSVDIRGDTDESWSRGLAWLLKHRILAEAAP